MHMPEGWELILVLLVIVVVFGSKRLPDSARALGRSMRILKAETKGLHEDDATPTTTARVVPPVAASPVAPPEPVVVQDPAVAQAYSGQQLYDAQGRPVQVGAPAQHSGAGSQQVQPAGPQA